MSKVFLIGILLITVVFISFLVRGRIGLASKKSSPEPSSLTTTLSKQKVPLNGFTLTPKSFNASDFTEFFENVKKAGNALSWSGNTEALNNPSSAPFVVLRSATHYAYSPILIFSEPNSAIASFAQKNKPPFIGIGVEINKLSTIDFSNFVRQFNAIYDQVKSVSPSTKVFTIFQLEMMKGLQGGLFGKTDNPDNNQWDLLKKLDKSDFIAFTTYPGLIYKTPADIPTNYYSEITSYTQKPIAFSEVGWQSDNVTASWPNDQNSQSQFIETFFTDTKSIAKEFTIWSFMYDQNSQVPFNSMGLFDKDGNEKKGWQTWINQKDK